MGGNNYIYIGEIGIIKFKMDDTVEHFYNPDLFPVIVGKKYVYHLFDGISAMKRELFPKKMSQSGWEDTYFNLMGNSKLNSKLSYESHGIKSKRLFEKDFKKYIIQKI